MYPPKGREALLSSIFSDETALFRCPVEPEPGDAVSVRLRLMAGAGADVALLLGFPAQRVHMSRQGTEGLFDWYEAKLYLKGAPVFYTFLIEWRGLRVLYDRLGPRLVEAEPSPDPAHAFRVLPGFHVPEWSKGAVQYQILVDRFRNGNPDNDMLDRECAYDGRGVRRAARWDALPEPDDFRCLYGGDLQGVMEKLDYLQSLGVEAVYFNPLFVSPSSHKYDTQDYGHIDPHLAEIPRDGGRVLDPEELDNARAERYIRRTTAPENLAASDAYFAKLCREMHRRSMKVILDGVFNHCGAFHAWMDREGVYRAAGRMRGDEHRQGADLRQGAWGHPESPCRSYFHFIDEAHYHCWWDIPMLPKLCYEQSAALCEAILRVAQRWAAPPYAIDGWRLDVAADLGGSRAFNHLFWKEFRRRVKAVNPDLLIIAEHYGDPSEWLGGDEWDGVMNYDGFMEPVSYFLTGMEKHSDGRRDDLYQNGAAFFDMMLEAAARMPGPSILCAMNELSNHDHSRFLTRTNGVIGRLNALGSAAAGEGVRPGVLREAAVIQMTWPGAPTLYYGDEAGLVGWTDPDNRRTYPWGREDAGLIALYRALAALRRRLPALRGGSVKPLAAGHGHIAFARFDGAGCAVVAVNNTEAPMDIELPLRDVGLPDGTALTRVFVTDAHGFDDTPVPVGTVREGVLRLAAGPCAAAILMPTRNMCSD